MLSLRRAENSDLEQLRQISIQTFKETFSDLNSEEDMKAYIENNLSTSKLADELNKPDSLFFLCYENNVLAAYMKINFVSAQTEKAYPDSLEIERIYVLKQFKGKGIGKLLLERAKEIALQNHLKYIWLGVWEKNIEAIAFYRKFGYKNFGNHVFILRNDRQTDCLFRLDLG